MEFEEWVRLGLDKGWCGPPVCATHDGVPSSEAEDNEFMDGDDPCLHIVRLYENPDIKHAVESSHAPSVWRASAYTTAV